MATALPPVQISSAEAAYLSGGIVSGIRGDGRGAADVRSIAIATGVLPSASGSGEARMGGAHVMVGVKVRKMRMRGEKDGEKESAATRLLFSVAMAELEKKKSSTSPPPPPSTAFKKNEIAGRARAPAALVPGQGHRRSHRRGLSVRGAAVVWPRG
jgi:hypothetical protein